MNSYREVLKEIKRAVEREFKAGIRWYTREGLKEI